MIEWLRAVSAEAQKHYVRAVELSMDQLETLLHEIDQLQPIPEPQEHRVYPLQFEDRTLTQEEPVDPMTRRF